MDFEASVEGDNLRASERGFQLLVQVAGRAGRHEKPGQVIVQMRQPQHTAIQCAANHDVRSFLTRELADRREVGYPPFSRLTLVRAKERGPLRATTAHVARVIDELPDAIRAVVDVDPVSML